MPIGDAYMVGKIPGTDVHWGLAVGIVLAIALYVLMSRTTFGFAARVTGGNSRAALAQGLPVGKLIVACCDDRRRLRRARRLLRGRGDPGPRQCLARRRLWLHRHPRRRSWRGTIRSRSSPVAIMFGGIVAAGGLIQRRMGLPDATVLVLQGLIFVVLLPPRRSTAASRSSRPATADRT